jgi:UDP-N-acetylglucosamine--N-acetylmuramyl-(pentapeptide) pyrophosphoryl-undecaprenol N-acetylglucosamine transferase
MKIVFAGGGTGGHFYPLIAVAEALRDIARERHLLAPQLYYLAPTPYDQEALFENEIAYMQVPAGKWRRYFSVQNYLDAFVTLGGVISALFALFRIYPDAVFSKGGFASVPVVIAANLLRIPVIIHESDAKPGRANIMASKHAYRIAVAFDSAAAYFPQKVRSRVARTGIPIRKELMLLESEGAEQELSLDPSVPTVLILGGSSGAKAINEVVLSAASELVETANIIHQTGRDLFASVETTAKIALEKSPNASRYHPFAYLSALSMRRAAGVASLVVSRAGATAVAEIALWKKPSILIPIPETVSHDQRANAYAYAKTGAAVVLEEANVSPHVLVSEVKRLLGDENLRAQMSAAAGTFANAEAAKIIAEELVALSLSHEPQAPVQTV